MNATGQAIVGARIEVLGQTAGTAKFVAIAHTITTTTGSFEVHVPAGASRVVEVAYRAFADDTTFAATATVTERVRAAIDLDVTPRHTSPTGTITLRGKVLGQIPAGGVTVALEVWYLGRWVPFRDPVTERRGRFSVKYQFEGARGVFPFRVKTLSGEAAFAYSTGFSRRVDVRTG